MSESVYRGMAHRVSAHAREDAIRITVNAPGKKARQRFILLRGTACCTVDVFVRNLPIGLRKNKSRVDFPPVIPDELALFVIRIAEDLPKGYGRNAVQLSIPSQNLSLSEIE